MSFETDKFIIENVTWNSVESTEVTANRLSSPRIKVGLKSAEVSCKACGHFWTAHQHRKGGLGGGIFFTCPLCAVEGKVDLKQLG